MQYHDNYHEWTDSAEIEAQKRQQEEEEARELETLYPNEQGPAIPSPLAPIRKVCRNGGVLGLALAVLFPTLAGASSACREAKDATEPGFARIVDADGKKHRFAIFVLGNEDIHEFGEFMASRKTAAMDPNRTLFVKTENGVDSIPNVQDCPTKKTRGKLKL